MSKSEARGLSQLLDLGVEQGAGGGGHCIGDDNVQPPFNPLRSESDAGPRAGLDDGGVAIALPPADGAAIARR